MVMSMMAGCGSSQSAAPSTDTAALENKTEVVDAAIEQATTAVEESGFSYTGAGPISEDGGTIKILAQTSNYSNVDITKAPIVEKVFEEAGVSPNWQLLDYNSYEEAITPMLSAGNIDADIIKIPDNDPNQVWIKSGMFVALDQYFDYMPNFTKWLSENPVQKAELTAEDGHIYYVAGVNVAHDYQPVLMYNQVWLDKAGKEAPENLDDFVELLRYFKENEKGVATMCKVIEDMRKEAIEYDRVEIAKDMIKDGMLSLEQIAHYSRLALEKVKELAESKPVEA